MASKKEHKDTLGDGEHEDAMRLYPSWVETLNHYSDLVLRIRITAITSGIIILAAAGTLLLREGNLIACVLVCVFGGLFSWVLWLIVANYYKHYEDWIDIVTKVEGKMRLPDTLRSWTKYKEQRREKRPEWKKFIVHYGCTTLIILAAVAILLMAFFVNAKKENDQKERTDVRTSQVSPTNSGLVR